MKKTALKTGNKLLKRTPLKSNKNGLKVNSSLKKVNFLKNKGTELKKTKSLKDNGKELIKTPLKKQNDKAKAKWEKVRNRVLERDNYKCVVCGKPATQVHHIHLRSKRKDLLYEEYNLVSLCNEHHDHSSTEGLERVNRRIADSVYLSLEDLLEYASYKKGDDEVGFGKDRLNFMLTPRENHYISVGYKDDEGKLVGRVGSEVFGFYWEDFEADNIMEIALVVGKILRLKPKRILLANANNKKTELTNTFEELLRQELDCEINIYEHDEEIQLWF